MRKNRFEFTDAGISVLSSPEKGKRGYFYDSITRGLGVSITSAGTKTFILYRWLDGKPERVTLGRFPDLSVEHARKLAAAANTKIAHGINPNEEKKRQKSGQAVLLESVLIDFLASKSELSERTVYDYKRILNVYLQDWKTKSIASIDQELVEHRHQAICNGLKVAVRNRNGELKERVVCSKAQANYSMRVLRVLMNFAMARYKDTYGRPILMDNPVKDAFQTPMREQSSRNRDGIQSHQLKAWFHAIINLKSDAANARPEVVKSFLVFLLMTGMKRQDAEKLRKTQLDFKSRALTLFDVENRQPYVLPLSDYLYVLLKQLVEATDSPYVFPGNGPKGHLIDPRKQLLKVIEESGVQFTLHDLRRTFIAVAESLDISSQALKQLLNTKTKQGGLVDPLIDPERLRKPMQMITDHILKCAEAKKSADMIALLSGSDNSFFQEKIGHILAVRRGVEAVRGIGESKFKT